MAQVNASTAYTQVQQASQPPQAKTAEDAAKEQQARKAQEANKPEQPKPVVNTQGQTTGKVINVTA